MNHMIYRIISSKLFDPHWKFEIDWTGSTQTVLEYRQVILQRLVTRDSHVVKLEIRFEWENFKARLFCLILLFHDFIFLAHIGDRDFCPEFHFEGKKSRKDVWVVLKSNAQFQLYLIVLPGLWKGSQVDLKLVQVAHRAKLEV